MIALGKAEKDLRVERFAWRPVRYMEPQYEPLIRYASELPEGRRIFRKQIHFCFHLKAGGIRNRESSRARGFELYRNRIFAPKSKIEILAYATVIERHGVLVLVTKCKVDENGQMAALDQKANGLADIWANECPTPRGHSYVVDWQSPSNQYALMN